MSLALSAEGGDAAHARRIREADGRLVLLGGAAVKSGRGGKVKIGAVRAERRDEAVDGRIVGDVVAPFVAERSVRSRVVDLVAHRAVERLSRVGEPRLGAFADRAERYALTGEVVEVAAGERRPAARDDRRIQRVPDDEEGGTVEGVDLLGGLRAAVVLPEGVVGAAHGEIERVSDKLQFGDRRVLARDLVRGVRLFRSAHAQIDGPAVSDGDIAVGKGGVGGCVEFEILFAAARQEEGGVFLRELHACACGGFRLCRKIGQDGSGCCKRCAPADGGEHERTLS